MFKTVNILLFIMCAIFLQGCSATKTVKSEGLAPVILNDALFERGAFKLTTQAELFTLSESQQQTFLNYYHKKLAEGEAAHEIVSDYLFKYISNFSYYGKTYTASQALELGKGNCMSLAVLTVALAQLVDLEFDFREVNTMPIFEKHGNLLLSSTHVQTRLFDPLYIPSQDQVLIFRPGIVIDYFPNKGNIKSRYLAFQEFISMYYQNIAADALVAGNLNLAYINAKAAYEYDNKSIRAHNLLALVHKRKGDVKTAESIYANVLKVEKENLSLINNYIVLLEHQQRIEEADALREHMASMDDKNPYSWLEQAYVFEKQGRHYQAIKHYTKAINMAPYIASAYLGLYKSQMAVGHLGQAKRTLELGIEWAYEKSERQMFKYKMYGRNTIKTIE